MADGGKSREDGIGFDDLHHQIDRVPFEMRDDVVGDLVTDGDRGDGCASVTDLQPDRIPSGRLARGYQRIEAADDVGDGGHGDEERSESASLTGTSGRETDD